MSSLACSLCFEIHYTSVHTYTGPTLIQWRDLASIPGATGVRLSLKILNGWEINIDVPGPKVPACYVHICAVIVISCYNMPFHVQV